MGMNNRESEAKKGMNRRRRASCFLSRRAFATLGRVARRLARCKGVKEVHLTSGKYGFVVFADADSSDEVKRISTSLMKVAKGKSVSIAVSHFIYK